MKFGFRKPSIKRSISAMTTAPLKRAILREIIPGYGKRGMGWANPKKAAYNHLYSMVTANPIDLMSNNPKRAKKHPAVISEVEYQHKQDEINIYKRGIEQSRVAIDLFTAAKDIWDSGNSLEKAIRRIFTYSSGYLNKPMSCGFDFCDMCEERLNNIQRIKHDVKIICLEIVARIRKGESAHEIYEAIGDARNKIGRK